MSGLAFRPRKPRKQVDLNVTSLVDVLFLLLIFFTLTSTFKRAGELDLQLPNSTSAGAAAAGKHEAPLEVVLTARGTLLVDGSSTTFDALEAKLRAVHERAPERQVTIDAEASVGHGQVVRILDAVRLAGFTGVGIGVRTATDAAAPRR